MKHPEERTIQTPNGSSHIKVLMYHRIVTDRNLSDRYWFCVHADDFYRQLELLERWGFSAITFEDYRLFLRGELDLPRKAVILTFDDGYLDTYEVAFQAVKQFQMKGVVFALGERKIRSNVWDEQIGLPSAPLMEGHHLLEMHMEGFEIGAHTMTHRELISLPEDAVWQEVTRSRMLLEILLNDKVLTFSYPFGSANPGVKRLVANAGYDLACAGEAGAAAFGADPYEIKRIKISNTTGTIGLALRVLTPFEYLTSAYTKGRALFGKGEGNGVHPANGGNGHAKEPLITNSKKP